MNPFTRAAIFVESVITELGILSEFRGGPAKRGRASEKCHEKAAVGGCQRHLEHTISQHARHHARRHARRHARYKSVKILLRLMLVMMQAVGIMQVMVLGVSM